jgi:hypothetical protein
MTITSVATLKLAIVELESAKSMEWNVLKPQLLHIADSLRPQNIVKTTFKNFVADQDLRSIAFHGVLGVTTGLLANTVLRAVAVGPVSKFVAGTITGMISNKGFLKNSPGIMAMGSGLLRKLFAKT